jgi:hypothetical protein
MPTRAVERRHHQELAVAQAVSSSRRGDYILCKLGG